mgnify:CR=1 FL=1
MHVKSNYQVIIDNVMDLSHVDHVHGEIISTRGQLSPLIPKIQENANIYKLNDKIKNIITEQKEMKSKMLVEKELINKRFDFVVESLIERNDVGNKTFLLELQLEKRKLIKSGYDSLMVQDSFLDIVNTFL